MKERIDFSSIEVSWPKKHVPFWGDDDSKLSQAHIHWIRQFEYDLANAFKQVADFAVSELRRGGDGTHPDRFALPILYLYRHAIELQIKEIVKLAISIRVLQSSEEIEKLCTSSHSLGRLWPLARLAMQTYWPEGDSTELDVVAGYIQILDRIDPDGQRFRYAEFTQKDKSKSVKEPAVQTLPDDFGLQYLADRISDLFGLLHGTEAAFMEAATNYPD